MVFLKGSYFGFQISDCGFHLNFVIQALVYSLQ